MSALSSFITLYLLIFIVVLIPTENAISSNNNNNDKTVSSTQIDIDEMFPVLLNSDIELETIVVNKVEVGNNVKDIETEMNYFQFSVKPEEATTQIKPDFWTTLYSIESKQGRLLYRPSNKNRNCATTSSPCGHHQLSLQALKDISCLSKQCMTDREDFDKSLAMSKQLQAINNKRLNKAGYNNLPEYQKYLIHQQGATGLKTILAASHGEKSLYKNIKKNMASNSPFSYKRLKRFGSKLAAKKFLKHWEQKWQDEKELVIVANTPKKLTESVIKQESKVNHVFFTDIELQLALNLKI
jgi:hypothetical protein